MNNSNEDPLRGLESHGVLIHLNTNHTLGMSKMPVKGPRMEFKLAMPVPQETPEFNLDDKCNIKLSNDSEEFEIRAVDLDVVEQLGKGGYGIVEKMVHRQSGTIMAVKRIKSSINDESQKRMLVELDACKQSDCCPQMVRFYGAMFREGDVWICMEVMDTSLDKFYRKAFKMGENIPEQFIGRVALSVVEGLNFMKEQMNLIHRDVKPSNILLHRKGHVKICDFGISGHLTNSIAKTVQAGCKPYMPPERINIDTKEAYDIRADVWSLGITIIEVSTGTHPYSKWQNPFQQLKQVVEDPAPQLPQEGPWTQECRIFVKRCLEKNYNERPKYPELLAMPWMEQVRSEKQFSMTEFIKKILDN